MIAPAPALTNGQTAPTAGAAVDTATPAMPVRAHRAAIEKVLSPSMYPPLDGGPPTPGWRASSPRRHHHTCWWVAAEVTLIGLAARPEDVMEQRR
jgi:hypothetical protein